MPLLVERWLRAATITAVALKMDHVETTRALGQSGETTGTKDRHTLSQVMSLLIRYRELTWQMAKRELSERYASHWLAALWLVLHPLVMMAVYVFIFAFVLKIRLGPSYSHLPEYALYILSGLIPWMSFQDSMNKGCSYITANARLVKQVVFPFEILPIKGTLTSFVNQLIATIFLVGYALAQSGTLRWTYALLPVLFVCQLLAMAGVGYFLASVSVYFRDLSELVRVFSFIGMFLIPVFYLPEWTPGPFRAVIYMNPFSYLIWCYQDALYFGQLEHWWAWCVFPPLSVLTLYLGYRTFQTLRVMFANVL